MVVGVGTDIVEIMRIKKAVEKNSNFINRIFSKNEIEYLERRNLRPEFVAGRFAAKEAVSKALGTGFSGFDFQDIEIDRTVSGKPIVILKGNAKLIAEKYGNYYIHLSISHSRENAIAFCLMEVKNFENYFVTDDEKDR